MALKTGQKHIERLFKTAALCGEVSHTAIRHLGASPRKLKADIEALEDPSVEKVGPFGSYGKIKMVEEKDEGLDRSYVLTKKAIDAGVLEDVYSEGVFERYGSRVRKDRARYKDRAKPESTICICLKEAGCRVFEDEHYMPVIDSDGYVMDVPFGESHYYTSKSLRDEERVRLGTEKTNVALGRNYGIWFAPETTYVVYYIKNKGRFKSARSKKYNGKITSFNRESERRTWTQYTELLRSVAPDRTGPGKRLESIYFGKTLSQLTRQLAFSKPGKEGPNSLERHFRESRAKAWFIPADRSKRFLECAARRRSYASASRQALFPEGEYRTSGGSFLSFADAVSADGSVYLCNGIDMDVQKLIAFRDKALRDASHRCVLVCFDWQEKPYRVYFGESVEYAVVGERDYWERVDGLMG